MIRIAVLKGDGIGPEVIPEAMAVMQAAAKLCEAQLDFKEGLIGGAAIDATGSALPIETTQLCRNSDAVLHGPVGGSRWEHVVDVGHPKHGMEEEHPKQAILGLRAWLGSYANVRPIHGKGLEVMVVRDISSGLYYGQPRGFEDGRAVNTMSYSETEVRRVAKVAFEAARRRRHRLHSADFAKILECGQLWRQTVEALHSEYPDVELIHIDADNAAYELARRPKQFDVLLSEITVGEMLASEAIGLVGTVGILPSADLGGRVGIFSPAHGSARDITGQGIANPTAAILAGSMLFDQVGLTHAANHIRIAVRHVLDSGACTPDMQGCRHPLTTREMSERIQAALSEFGQESQH